MLEKEKSGRLYPHRTVEAWPTSKLCLRNSFVVGRGTGKCNRSWYTGNFDQTYEDVLEGCTAFLEIIMDNL